MIVTCYKRKERRFVMKYKEPMTYFPKSIRKELGMEEEKSKGKPKTKTSAKPKKKASRTTKKKK